MEWCGNFEEKINYKSGKIKIKYIRNTKLRLRKKEEEKKERKLSSSSKLKRKFERKRREKVEEKEKKRRVSRGTEMLPSSQFSPPRGFVSVQSRWPIKLIGAVCLAQTGRDARGKCPQAEKALVTRSDRIDP